MPTIQEQKEAVRIMLASSPDAWISVGAFVLQVPTSGNSYNTYCATDYWGGFTANDSYGASRAYKFVPISFNIPSVSADMVSSVVFNVSDLNKDGTSLGSNISIRNLVDSVPDGDTRPLLISVYIYISYPDGTFSGVAEGPYELEVTDITFTDIGCSFTAKSPDAVYASCGEIYTVERFPMLEQFK
jgi:hypothetical protein